MGRGVKMSWGSLEKANISRATNLEAGRDDVRGFKVDDIRGADKLGDES
jgi:hypothetical protein